jgi:hypothetical protein
VVACVSVEEDLQVGGAAGRLASRKMSPKSSSRRPPETEPVRARAAMATPLSLVPSCVGRPRAAPADEEDLLVLALRQAGCRVKK